MCMFCPSSLAAVTFAVSYSALCLSQIILLCRFQILVFVLSNLEKKLGIQILVAVKEMIERILWNVRGNKRIVGVVEAEL